jgi:hypothetical protein
VGHAEGVWVSGSNRRRPLQLLQAEYLLRRVAHVPQQSARALVDADVQAHAPRPRRHDRVEAHDDAPETLPAIEGLDAAQLLREHVSQVARSCPQWVQPTRKLEKHLLAQLLGVEARVSGELDVLNLRQVVRELLRVTFQGRSATEDRH